MKAIIAIGLLLIGCDQKSLPVTPEKKVGPLNYGDVDFEITVINRDDSTVSIRNNGTDSVPLSQISVGIREAWFDKGCINTGMALHPTGFLIPNQVYVKHVHQKILSDDYFEVNGGRIIESNLSNNCKLGSGIVVECCKD